MMILHEISFGQYDKADIESIMNLVIDDFGASYRSIFVREYLDKLHHRFACKKRRTAIVMHECDNSGVFNNIMRIFHSIPEPEILCPRARYLVCVYMCMWTIKICKTLEWRTTMRRVSRRCARLYGIHRVSLFVQLFDDLLATTTPGRAIAANTNLIA